MKLYKSIAWLRRRFVEERKTIAEMSAESGVSEMTIRRALQEKGLLR